MKIGDFEIGKFRFEGYYLNLAFHGLLMLKITDITSRYWQKALVGILALLCLLLMVSCNDKASENPISSDAAVRTINISIVHDNDLKLEQWLQKTIDAFQQKHARHEHLNFKLQAASMTNAIDEIADGRLKPDAVILPHKGFSSLINSKVVNLGARVGDCQDLISSPYVAVAPAAYLDQIRNIATITPSKSDSDSKIASPEYNLSMDELNKVLRHSNFGFVNPARSTRGSFALLLTIASASPSFFDNSTDDKPDWEQALQAAKSLKSNFEWYAPSDALILKRLVSQNSDIPGQSIISAGALIPLGLMSEKQLGSESYKDLIVLKTTDYSLRETHSLCISQADWVTDQKSFILHDLQKFMTSDPAIESARQMGFTDSTERKIEIASPEILLQKSLASLYDKKKAISIAIDTSASMSQRDLDISRDFALRFLNKSSDDQLDLLTFSSDVTFWNEKSGNQADIREKLRKVSPSGGSSIYDALVRQYRGLEKYNKNDFSKVAIIITDGGDKNSAKTLQDVLHLSGSSSNGDSQKIGFVSLHIIAIDNESGELKSLHEISEAAAGNFYQIKSDSLPNLLAELEELLK